MKREVDLKDISDGRLYGSNDMVKADCGDCEGCSACCQGMGQSIILDPMDVHRLMCGLGTTFEDLVAGQKVELNVVDGIILPNLKMAGEKECCSFLNQEGRCSIHSSRPGICRLFPLGRYYADGGFQYFLQVHECKKQDRAKVKVKKWIDTPDTKTYEKYVNAWHDFLMGEEKKVEQHPEMAKEVCMGILQIFYMTPYGKDFYAEFWKRLERKRSECAASSEQETGGEE